MTRLEGSPPPPARLVVAEIDGDPSGQPTTLQFPNGTVSDQGSGVYRYTPAASSGPAGSAPTQPANAVDTVYQNTGTSIRRVQVLIAGDAGGCTSRWEVGPADPPTAVQGPVITTSSSVQYEHDFLVPAGYYYRIATASGPPTIVEWTEWQF